MASAEFTREGSADDPDGLTIRFRGRDQDRVDDAERKLLLSTPSRHGKYGAPPAGGAKASFTRLALLSPFLALVALLVPQGLLILGALFGTMALVVLLTKLFERLLPRARPVPEQVFTLRLGRLGFCFESDPAQRLDLKLAAVEGFEGGRRLAVRRADGGLKTLPGALWSGDHAELARALNDELALLRASRGGYRGAPPALTSSGVRVPDAEVSETLEPEIEGADEEARARRR